jgi:adenylate cyclase
MSSGDTEFRQLAAIMFTDMVGYSALAQRNEALALELLEEHRRQLRLLFPKHQGDEVKTMGDGFLVEFPSALAAVRCAIDIQTTLAERNTAQPPERRLQIRIGIHVGDIVRQEKDMFGDGVNIAARIEPLAEPGGICISEDVARQVRNKIDHSLVQISAGELKNIQMPVMIYKLMLTPGGGLADSGWKVSKNALEQLRSLAVPAVVALLLFLGGGLLFWLLLGRGSSHPLPDASSVAVLPFVNMSSDREIEHLCDGLTEELIGALAKVKGMRVPSRTTAFAYKDKSQDIQAIGRQLNVRAVLEGSVRKSDKKLRITAQLINVADGYHLWSDTYERDSGEVFALQSDIAQRVTEAVQDQFGMGETLGGLHAIRAGLDR